MKRIVVTEAATPLARLLIAALRACPDVERVLGVVDPARVGRRRSDDEVAVPLVPDHRPFGEMLVKEGVDTVVQCGLVPDRTGAAARTAEADVIATMCLGAALSGAASPVRSWVVASSSALYPIDSHMGLMQTEDRPVPVREGTPGESIAEAEDYARDVALRFAHLDVSILRLQHLAGAEVRGALVDLLRRDPVPVPIGFDPLIQLLHVDDAVSALAFAARHRLAGLYNVASADVIHWGDAVRATGHRAIPVLPVRAALFEPVLARLGVPHFPAELLDLMRFGHAVDTSKIERAGWRPRKRQIEILREPGAPPPHAPGTV